MAKQISAERKAAFYIGTGLSVVGLLVFLSNFVSVELSPARALGGMGLIAAGGVLRGLGQRGLAGSGLVLDPPQARRDLEPFSRMAGGMLKDALGEANVDLAAKS